jgi:O-antigen/teichoic acid export membrane protein
MGLIGLFKDFVRLFPVMPSRSSALFRPVSTNAAGLRSGLALAKGAALLVLGGVAAQGLAALTGLLVARSLGPAAYGVYAAAFALVGAFAYTFTFGLDGILVREIARHPAQARVIIPSAGLPALIWSLLLVAFIIALGTWFGDSFQLRALLLVAAPATGLRGLVIQVRAALRGFERMGLDALIQSAEGGAVLALARIALRVRPSALYAGWAILLGELAAFCIALFILHVHIGPFQSFHRLVFRRMLRAALPLGLTFTLVGVNLRLELLLLGALSSQDEVGVYAAALGIVMLSRSLSLVSAALLPRLAAAYAGGVAVFSALFRQGLVIAAATGSLVGLGTSLFAPHLLMLLYGPDYLGGASALRVLAIMGALLFVNTYLWQALIAMNQQGRVGVAVLVSMLATLAISWWLVPVYGSAGAALAALARELLQLAVLSFFVGKRFL